MREKLEEIKKNALDVLQKATDIDALEEARIKFLGKKGELTAVLKGMGQLSKEERPQIGALANEIRGVIENHIDTKKAEISEKLEEIKLKSEVIDVTMPGKAQKTGKLHPLTKVMNNIKDTFIGMGFEIAEGPEVELDYYNFEALNIPPNHPARDTQDTFYINENTVLRTQTSPIQVRVMEKKKPPIRIIAPGRVYRSDAVDATHSPVFHQIEGLVVDKGVTMADLRVLLKCLSTVFTAKIQKYVSDLTISRLQSRQPKLTFRVSLAVVKAAAYVKARAGLKFWAAVWYTLRYLQTAVLTLKYIRALLSVSVLKELQWVSMILTTLDFSLKMI